VLSNEYIATTARNNRWSNDLVAYHNFEKGGLGSIVGKVTDFVGLTDYEGQEAAQAQASKQAASATQISRENLAFMKQQYADWKDVYGDIQKNLGDYYENVSGSSIAAKQLSAYAKEYAAALKTTNQTLAQRGIDQSGLAAATEMAMNMQGATTRAGIRASADDMARQQQLSFLGVGLNQGQSLLGNIGNAANSVSQGYMNQANQNSQISQTLFGANQAAMGGAMTGFMQSPTGSSLMNSVGSTIKSGIGAIGNIFSDVRLKNNIRQIGTQNGLNIYEWEWNDLAHSIGADKYPTRGVLAQEVKHLGVVSRNSNGYLMVDYDKLGVR
jgi:hypothetical protein